MPSLAPLSGNLTFAQAKHLLRRTTYRYNKARIDALTGTDIGTAVDALFNYDYATVQVAEPIDHETGQPWINGGVAPQSSTGRLRHYVLAWFFNEALLDETARFRTTFFLHTLMPIHIDFGTPEWLFDYLALLRFQASGSLSDLAYRMTLDNTMLNYLDNDNNNKWNPNENYAREFLELFTIGKGPQIAPQNYTNYTEQDIQVGAELLTGWRRGDRANPAHRDPVTGLNQGYPKHSWHKTNDKTFSAAFQNTTITAAVDDADMHRELRDYVNLIFAQAETARYYCRRIYRYFIGGEISAAVETDIIEPLAVILRNANYDLPTALKALFKSEFFYGLENGSYSDANYMSILRSPVDLGLQTLALCEVAIPPVSKPEDHYHNFWFKGIYQSFFEKASMRPFQPDSVAGYPAYYQEPIYHRIWFTSASMVARYKVPDVLLRGKPLFSNASIGTQLNTVVLVETSGLVSDPTDSALLVADLLDYFFGEPPPAGRLADFENALLDGFTPSEWTMEWADYQSTKDDTSVRIALDRLFYRILYSQEYQLM